MTIHSSADQGYVAPSWCSKCLSADLNCGCDADLPIVSQAKLSIDDDYGSETFIRTIDCSTLLGLRNAVRELNCGHIPIYSDYDCTGLVCGQWCKFIKIYKRGAGYVAVVEITVSRDV